MKIASLIQNDTLRSNMLTLQREIAETQRQVSSGRKSDTYGGLGVNARASIDLRNATESLDSYSRNIASFQLRAEPMQNAMEDIGDIANRVREEILKQRDASDPDTRRINQVASDALDQVIQRLNYRVDDRFVFAGKDTGTRPMANADDVKAANAGLLDAAGINDYVNDADGMLDAVRQFFQNDPPQDYYVSNDATNDPIRMEIDRDLSVEYGVRGNEEAFQKIFRALYVASEIEYDPDNTEDFWNVMMDGTNNEESVSGLIRDGFQDLNIRRAQLGDQQALADRVEVRLEDAEKVFTTQLSNIEDVDIAEASTRLFALQGQLQASYQMVSQARQLTLTNFL